MTGPTLSVPQAVVVRDSSGPRLVGKSHGLTFELEEAVLGAAVRFGPRPPGVACPGAVFGCPLGDDYVGVVQVTDMPGDGSALGFRFLLFYASDYTRDGYLYLGDPFAVADRFPPDWSGKGDLPALTWVIDGPPPRRTVEKVRQVLKREPVPLDDSSPVPEVYLAGQLLLGTTQALLDGARVAVVRPGPDPDFVRGVWELLPDKARAELWPATFAFSADLGFHLTVLASPPPVGYLTEEQAKDYPEGRYELALQTAAEAGDQAELDRLFARKTSREVLRLAVMMVVFALLVAVVMKFL
jgi:hypothetical protein